MEKIRNFVVKLRLFSYKHPDWAILVEGKRDRNVLERLGVENVIDLKGRKFHDVAEFLADRFKGVVLLTDFDPEGEEIFRKLNRILKGYGLRVDGGLREELRQTGVKFVEEILTALRRKNGGRL